MKPARDFPTGRLRPWLRDTAGLQGPGLVLLASRPGVGKSTFLVQTALDELLAGGQVLHVALGEGLSQVESRYQQLAGERLVNLTPARREQLGAEMTRNRAIQALEDRRLTSQRLETVLQSYRQHLQLQPRLVLVDGADSRELESAWDSWRQLAADWRCELWFATEFDQQRLAELRQRGAVMRAVMLEPRRRQVTALALDGRGQPLLGSPLSLSADRLLPPEAPPPPGDARHFTLLSGAAAGAEQLFGELAEAYGMTERNFSFAGRSCQRRRGLVLLDEQQLQLGEVSWSYFTSRTGRQFTASDKLRRVIQTIWHQVNPAAEIFCVGALLDGGAVKGGTGWAVELAKQQQKPVWVFDQLRACWYEWFGDDWRLCNPPSISQYRFCGTGTRHLNDSGRQAIIDLFVRSFGPVPDGAA